NGFSNAATLFAHPGLPRVSASPRRPFPFPHPPSPHLLRLHSLVLWQLYFFLVTEPLEADLGMTTDKVLSLILGGGAGQRLYPLTQQRAKPAVPLCGKYRLIDIPLSTCINSNLRRIFILTKYNSASLNRHIARTYSFSRFTNGFVEILAAEITPERPDWFQGTADAVRQCLHHLDDYKGDTILILSGDHLYRMDYRHFIARHEDTGADITLSVTAALREDASGFGLVKIDDSGRVVEFSEKPQGEALERMFVDTTQLGLSREQAERRPFCASMGIYVFRKDVLRKLLVDDMTDAVDFGR